MSKIIELPKIKPITCDVCGCKYELEIGDKIQSMLAYCERDAKGIPHREVLTLNLACPFCGAMNVITRVD